MATRTPIKRAVHLHRTAIPAAEAKVRKLRSDLDAAVLACHEAGMIYREIADALGISTSMVQVIVQRAKGTPSPSRRVKEVRG